MGEEIFNLVKINPFCFAILRPIPRVSKFGERRGGVGVCTVKQFRWPGGHNFLEGINHCICHIFGNLMVGVVSWHLHSTCRKQRLMHQTSHITQNKIIEILNS